MAPRLPSGEPSSPDPINSTFHLADIPISHYCPCLLAEDAPLAEVTAAKEVQPIPKSILWKETKTSIQKLY